jgi:hypothetical protein
MHIKRQMDKSKKQTTLYAMASRNATGTLEKAKHAWVDELPSVLWSMRTTPNAATQ